MSSASYKTYLQEVDPQKSLPRSTWFYQRRVEKRKVMGKNRYDDKKSMEDEVKPDEQLVVEECNQETCDKNYAMFECSGNDNESCYESTGSECCHEPLTEFADDSENELSDSDFDFVENKQKMYDGCPLTLDESAVLLMQIAICHKITGKALLDLMSVIKAHLPIDCRYFSYVNQMKNILSNRSDSPMEITSFCDSCMHSLDDVNFCPTCNIQAKETSQFIKLSIGDQIKTFYQDAQFWMLIL